MKKLLLLAVTLALTLGISATPDISTDKKYHIVCSQFPYGCVTDGVTAGEPTPLYYFTSATTDNETYWIFTEEAEGLYSIKNYATGQYITYDGVRETYETTGSLRRYVSMTDNMDGDNSLWRLVPQTEGVYVIRNAKETTHLWDVRTDSYCVGTYSSTDVANQNQRFSFYDDEDNLVTEKTETTDVDGYDVTTWLVATTESPDGWTFEGTAFTDPGFGNYSNGSASVYSPFLERWNKTTEGALPNDAMKQTLENLPEGQYVLTADVIAVRQPGSSGWYTVSEEQGYNVYLFAGEAQTEAGTWSEQPQNYTVEFTVGSSGTVTLGLRIQYTNANWVVTDNFKLYFQGTEAALVAGEKAKVRAELADYYSEAEIETMMAGCGDDFNALEDLRRSVALLPKKDPLAKVLRNLCIDGRSMAYAKSIGLYLATVDESVFGNDYSATITYDKKDGWDNLVIDGTEVASGDTYTFHGVMAGDTYTFSCSKDDGMASVTQTITFTALPVVRINGSFNNNYSEGYIQVFEPTVNEMAEVLSMKAKWRGGITNGDSKHKRNYHVKLKDADGNKLEKKFFGLRNDNSWILEACQVDMSRIRNRVLTDLWNDYSTPPYYKELEKKAKTGTRGQFVEVILNDEYRGIYCMTENMDRKQMQLKKYDEENGVTHGQLWKSKDWTFATLMGSQPDSHYWPKDYLSTPSSTNSLWDKYEVKYPDFEDYGNQTDWSTLYDAVSFVCYASDDDFREHFSEYFDMPVVIDYYILQECILSTDNHGKNMFFACYDKQEDKKITFGVWDMDATCGQRWSDDWYHNELMQPEQDYSEFIAKNEHGDYNLFKRLRDTDTDNFNERVRQRYRELRDNYLATDNILDRFGTYLNRFKLCGAAEREYAKWNGDTDISGLNLDFDNEMDYITDWFTRRMNYLDTQRFKIFDFVLGDINDDGTVDVSDYIGVANHILGKTPAGFNKLAADVNDDGVVDVADYIGVANIILTGSIYGNSGSASRPDAEDEEPVLEAQ